MDLLIREYGVLCVHELVHEHAQRVSVICVLLHSGLFLELREIEVGHLGLVLQLADDLGAERHWLAYLGNAVLDIDVLYVQHAETLDGGVLNDLEGLEERVKEELNMFFLEADTVGLELVRVVK